MIWRGTIRVVSAVGDMLLIGVAAFIVMALLGFFILTDAFGEELIEPTAQEAIDIQSWIPQSCCRTNNCCRKVRAIDLVPLRDNKIRVVSTGQVLPRTGWSQDKNTWRCTCDFIDGQWVVHAQANTRCVFDHNNGF